MAKSLSKSKVLTCFKAYDVRGELGVDFDVSIAYRIGRAVAQHFGVGEVVIGRDARQTSLELMEAVTLGICDAGSKVLDLGLAGTEEMYWAVTEFKSLAGIMVTASHNPINYNGLKIVKSGSHPLDDTHDFQVIKRLAETEDWGEGTGLPDVEDISVIARAKYVKRVLSFVSVDALRPLRVVLNSGNGAAGPTIDAIIMELERLGAPVEFIRVHHQPDCSFPNGIPNPLLPENHGATSNVVKSTNADFGVAFDGDFDRCFFFDGSGKFVPGEYALGLLASTFLDKEEGATIIHDPRVIWNTQDIVSSKGGIAVQSQTGHAFMKQTMRKYEAVYGGEVSSHHYFRDFAYCDSGIIPWLLIAELVSTSEKSLADWVEDRFKKFPSSGENNFIVHNADEVILNLVARYESSALSIDKTDGVSLSFEDWRFNLRKSNTEPLIRLNIEAGGNLDLLVKKHEILTRIINSKIQTK